MTPGVYSSLQHINETRAMLEERLDDLVEDEEFELVKLNEFAMSPTFYLIYQGLSDVKFLTALHDTYARGHPSLHAYPSTDKLPPFPPVREAKATSDDKSVGVDSNSGSALVESASAPSQPLRVGFVSSHFRRHSICKLFCGVIQDLAKTTHTSVNNKNTSFQVYVFSGQDESREDKYTKQLKDSVHLFVRLSRFTVPARQEVLKRQIDVLIYLDIGMDPSTTVWGASKLAPIQMCIWGHPSTTGLRSMDYYISSELFHRDLSPQYRRTEEIFLEQVVRLPSTLGIAFERPVLSLSSPVTDEDLIHRPTDFLNAVNDTLGNAKPANITLSPFGAPATIATLVDKKARGEVLILIPQHLPKFHPDFDVVIRDLLESVPDASVVITYDVKKSMWRQTLETRWKKEAGFSEDMIKERILWMESLTPQQYLAMLSLGDVMVDPFPFGGGVTTLEALAVCTPVITLPTHQNVPALTAGMLRTLAPGDETSVHVDHIYSSVDDFIKGARRLLTDSTASVDARRAICRDVHNLYVDSNSTNPTVAEWAELIVTTSTPNAEEVMITPDANITSVGDSDSE